MTQPDYFTDKDTLTTEFYGSDEKLSIRLNTWKKHGTNRVSLANWIIQNLPEFRGPVCNFLDIGCGTGELLSLVTKNFPHIQSNGIDLSPVMQKSSLLRSPTSKIVVGDAQALPYLSNAFNIVTAIHMLYHVPDIIQALKECYRVLKPGSVLFLTASDFNLESGMNLVHYKALKQLGMPEFMQDRRAYLRFPPTKAERLLKKLFIRVNMFIYKNTLVFHDAEAFMRYYRTAMMYRNTQGVADPRIKTGQWSDLEATAYKSVATRIKKNGKFCSKSTIIGLKAWKHK